MKRLFYLSVILLIVGAAIVGCEPSGLPSATPQPTVQAQATAPVAVVDVAVGDAANGQQLFSTTCSVCHGPAGEGVQGLGKDMTKSEFIAGLSDDELVAFIEEGRRISDPLNTTGVDMPPKGGNPGLTTEQLTDIVAYIRSIHLN